MCRNSNVVRLRRGSTAIHDCEKRSPGGRCVGSLKAERMSRIFPRARRVLGDCTVHTACQLVSIRHNQRMSIRGRRMLALARALYWLAELAVSNASRLGMAHATLLVGASDPERRSKPAIPSCDNASGLLGWTHLTYPEVGRAGDVVRLEGKSLEEFFLCVRIANDRR